MKFVSYQAKPWHICSLFGIGRTILFKNHLQFFLIFKNSDIIKFGCSKDQELWQLMALSLYATLVMYYILSNFQNRLCKQQYSIDKHNLIILCGRKCQFGIGKCSRHCKLRHKIQNCSISSTVLSNSVNICEQAFYLI